MPAPAPAKKAPPKPVKGHDQKFVDSQRILLLSERVDYEESLRSFLAEADQLAADMEPGDTQFDDESGEGDPLGMERERDLAMASQARSAIEEIDHALAKMELGTYGICENCQQPIMKERLKALPFASLCVACKSGGITARRGTM
ncbi:MAG: TraR/DksA family transcriptional regulator [Acidimicrobiia bacterium]